MHYVHLPMKGRRYPSDAEVQSALSLFTDKSAGPIFVHCRQGRDRTGSVVAAYRIAHDRWTSEQALAEAKSCGLHWYERGMTRFILGYRAPAAPVAIEKLAARAGDGSLPAARMAAAT